MRQKVLQSLTCYDIIILQKEKERKIQKHDKRTDYIQ